MARQIHKRARPRTYDRVPRVTERKASNRHIIARAILYDAFFGHVTREFTLHATKGYRSTRL